jgi:hypothetical protein
MGHIDFILSGFDGNANIIVKFTAKVTASSHETQITKVIGDPTSTIDGRGVVVKNWNFDN